MEALELTLETSAGLADIRLEPLERDEKIYYNATILLPRVVSGSQRSEIFCFDLFYSQQEKVWRFHTGEDGMHPEIAKMEPEISSYILSNG